MNKILLFLIPIILLAILIGCSEDENPVTTTTKGSISGKVTDQSTGNTLSGASISTIPATSSVTSDSSGNYSLANVEAGNYSVVTTMNGYNSNTSTVNVTADQNSTVNILLAPIPNPDPIAAFNYGGTLVTPATITFTNTSQNADTYLWNFGDGTTSSQQNPNKSYNQHGTYTVTLTASNSGTGKSNQTSQSLVITPGKVFLKTVTINDIPLTKPSGGGWDLTSGPDVYFTIIDSVGTDLIDGSSNRYNDVIQSMLPLSWQFTPELEFLMSAWNKTYYIRVWDWDATGDEIIGTTNGFKITQLINSNYATNVVLQSSNAETNVSLNFRWQ